VSSASNLRRAPAIASNSVGVSTVPRTPRGPKMSMIAAAMPCSLKRRAQNSASSGSTPPEP